MAAVGDPERFASEVAPLHLRLVRLGYLLVGDRAVAEECAQEALLRAWARVQAGEVIASLEAWTTTVALNACRSALRRRGAEARALARLPHDRGQIDGPAPDLASEVHRAVLALPPRQREVVVLRYFLDLDLAAIAERTGTSAGAVKNALHHARASLATQLRADVDPADLTTGDDR
jgi:RNA polymerase sigma factor (sigma-70 family)